MTRPRLSKFFLSFFLGGLTILQVGSYKARGGKRVFLIAPYHHHLQFKGWPESRVVMSFWIGTAVCGVVALGLQRVL